MPNCLTFASSDSALIFLSLCLSAHHQSTFLVVIRCLCDIFDIRHFRLQTNECPSVPKAARFHRRKIVTWANTTPTEHTLSALWTYCTVSMLHTKSSPLSATRDIGRSSKLQHPVEDCLEVLLTVGVAPFRTDNRIALRGFALSSYLYSDALRNINVPWRCILSRLQSCFAELNFTLEKSNGGV